MNEKHIDIDTARKLLQHYETPDHVVRHCTTVARVSTSLASALKEKGFQLSEELVFGSAMVHDIARVFDALEEVGASLLVEEGYPEEAAIVRRHMHHEVAPSIRDMAAGSHAHSPVDDGVLVDHSHVLQGWASETGGVLPKT